MGTAGGDQEAPRMGQAGRVEIAVSPEWPQASILWWWWHPFFPEPEPLSYWMDGGILDLGVAREPLPPRNHLIVFAEEWP
jgi:hypothetical protein